MSTPVDDDYRPWAPARPYSAECAASEQRRAEARASKSFKPTPPSERRKVDQVLDKCSGNEDTAQSLLSAAFREQDRRGTRAGVQNFTPERFRGMPLRKFGLGKQAGPMGRSAVFATDAVDAPRKLKQRKAGRSMPLMDLAFAGGGASARYTPISLPYVDFKEEDQEEVDDAKKKGRPTLTRLDEANEKATKDLFLEADGSLKEDKYLLIQLPAVLPELLDGPDDEDASVADAGSIMQYPDGLVGKLRVHKSGKVSMEIGGMPFCIDKGCETFFQQDLACVCPDEIYDLGPVKHRVILSPDVDAMLAAAPAPTAAGSSASPADAATAAASSAALGAPSARAAQAAAPAASNAASAGGARGAALPTAGAPLQLKP